ncbi:MAG: hypothetical protein V3T86_15990 [Planctomycetota bacterium]
MGAKSPTVLHIGTDEAGYGPLLGPLVVAAAVWTCRPPKNAAIADSKVVFRQGKRDALAGALGPYLDAGTPLTLTELLARHSIREDPRDQYEWYGEVRDESAVPRPAPKGFAGLLLNPVCERAFNRGCEGPGGKAGLLFKETMRLIREALLRWPDVPVEIVCDKHGGRNNYAGLLMQELGPSTVATGRESRDVSSYRLTVRGRLIRIRFVKHGESADPAVALASMAAKYTRELFMESFNRFFVQRMEGLRPTAGYYTDGRRFLDDVDPLLRKLQFARETLVRLR